MLRTNLSFLSFIESICRQSGNTAIEVRRFEPGAVLMLQGTKSFKVLVFKTGIAKCFFSEENGRDYIVEFLGQGEIVGEIEAMKDMACLCNVQALTGIEAYSIPLDHFKKMLQENTTLSHLLLQILAERIINTSSRASFQQLYTLNHGVQKLLELQERYNIQIGKDDMAAYLGITTRSLNRALKELQAR